MSAVAAPIRLLRCLRSSLSGEGVSKERMGEREGSGWEVREREREMGEGDAICGDSFSRSESGFVGSCVVGCG